MVNNISYASIEWQPGGEPYSPTFKDVYFRSGQGLDETRYVFLQGNHLPQRWQGHKHFTIVETGFGTGLNFLATWQLWKASPHKPVLHYISFEQSPLRPADLRKIYRLWPELADIGQALLAQYPPALPGFHRIFLEEGNIVLTLVWGNMNATLPTLEAEVDCWFLDGFAPRQNPEMWGTPLATQMKRLTASHGTFATFTSAGYVRRGLQALGFTVEKINGFDGKREMLRGSLTEATTKTTQGTLKDQPWFSIAPQPEARTQHAVVIGGGLAGTAAAYSLARRGWDITLLERHNNLAQEASGNPSGIVMPLITAPDDIVGQFYLTAYSYALRHYTSLSIQNFYHCGVLQLASSKPPTPDHPALHSGIMLGVSADEASILAGIRLPQGGWFFPHGGWISPPDICNAHISAYPHRITTRTTSEAISLEHKDDIWHILGKEGNCLATAPVVIIANAFDAMRFELCSALPLRRVRGQVTYLPTTPETAKLQTILCDDGYIIPAVDGIHCIGATFQPDNIDATLSEADHTENIATISRMLGKPLNNNSLDGRVGFRTASPDRRPLVGTAPNVAQFHHDYHDISYGKQYQPYPAGTYLPGLYLSLGHGSRGLVSTPLAAELIACQITGEPLPVEKQLVDALNPARFLIRKLKHSHVGQLTEDTP